MKQLSDELAKFDEMKHREHYQTVAAQNPKLHDDFLRQIKCTEWLYQESLYKLTLSSLRHDEAKRCPCMNTY